MKNHSNELNGPPKNSGQIDNSTQINTIHEQSDEKKHEHHHHHSHDHSHDHEPEHEHHDSTVPHTKLEQAYRVYGMDCSSCALTVEKAVAQLPAVKGAQVHFSTGKLKVQANEAIAFEPIMQTVEKLGYSIEAERKIHENKRTNTTQKWSKDTISLLIASSLIVIGFGLTYTAVPQWFTTLLFAAVIAICGYKPMRSAFYAIKSKSLDMNVLMTGAAIGAMFIGEWFEGATVVWLFSIGTYLQTRSIEKTRQSISNLMDLAPAEAIVKVNDQWLQKSVESVHVGETMLIKPGEKIPLDGEIIVGESTINEAPITGESIPVDKKYGDTVFAGTMNEQGTLEIKVTKLVADTTIAKIIQLVEEAQEKKAPTEAFVDQFAKIYTPIVFIAAIVLMIIPPIIGLGNSNEWFYKGLELLVVACPCALVISTPVAIVSAIGNAAKNGVLIKGGTFLEMAGKIDAVAFDKTGTLTEGKPAVSMIQVTTGSEQQLLEMAYTLEQFSTHPIASAIIKFAHTKGIKPIPASNFINIVGKGVQATIDNTKWYAGNEKLFREMNTPIDKIRDSIEQLQHTGHTVIIIGTAETIYGLLAVADQIRPNTFKSIDLLHKAGLKETIMLTGDNEGAAKEISKLAHVNRYFSNLMPEHKVKAIQQLQAEGRHVAMVGDGINDAPALATANLGIAMGGAGTDTAIETADIVLMADNLEKLPYTMNLSRKAIKIIKQNIIFSLIIKAIALAFIFPGWLTLWMAVLSDTGAALIVILNSLRLVRFKS